VPRLRVRVRDITDDCDSDGGLSEITWCVQTVGSGEGFGELWSGKQLEATAGKRT
jgi:hypothetical protein